jgi:hypothetical protein
MCTNTESKFAKDKECFGQICAASQFIPALLMHLCHQMQARYKCCSNNFFKSNYLVV